MKDYIVSNVMLPSNRQMLQLSMQVTNTTQSIAEIKKSLNKVEDDIAMGELSDVVRKSELTEIFENFSEANACRGYLFLMDRYLIQMWHTQKYICKQGV